MTSSSSAASKREALKSTSIIGASSAINMAIRMVRTKVLAILLGPAGVGLEGIYGSVTNLVGTVFNLGLGSSGVRQVSAATSTGDHRKIYTTVYALRQTCLVLGVLSAIALFFGRDLASRAAFGDTSRSTEMGWMAVVLLVGTLAAGWGALLQGLRRIADMAWMGIIGTVAGTFVSIPIVYVWGQDGIPAYMVANAVIGVLACWYFARRIKLERVRVSLDEFMTEVRGLIGLGIIFMLSGMMATGSAFLVRVMVIRDFGLEGAGQFQAANALSTVYIGFILGAMATDFYPRLTSISNDQAASNRLVNEQSDVSLTLALPGMLATVALAPWVLHVFYASSFQAASDILVWQVAGMLLRVMSWPLGYITVATARSGVFFVTELIAWSTYVLLAWLGIRWFGIAGAGMGFLGLYVVYVVMMYLVVRRLNGFRWSRDYLAYAGAALAVTAVVIWMRLVWPEPWATLLPLLLAGIAGIHTLRKLGSIIGRERLVKMLHKLRIAWILKLMPRLVK